MAESDYSFPTAPSFTESAFPPPPQRGAKTVDKYLKEIEQYLQIQLVGLTEMQASLTEGWIIDVLRVNGLVANSIKANSILTHDFFIGSDGSGSIEMSGSTTQIIIKDEAGTNRVIAGDFGASNDDWGIKVLDSTGTVKFQSTSITFMDGAVITNATIVDAKIVNLNGSKLDNSTVGNTKISDLSASKINAGTLTVTGSPAISVTSSGAVIFSAGGDIIFKATASDGNFISFRTSGNAERGSIVYSPASNIFSINNANGSEVFLDATFGTGTGRKLTMRSADITTVSSTQGGAVTVDSNITLNPSSVVVTTQNFRSTADNNDSCGIASFRWSDVRSVLINGADYGMENGVRMTEPDRVYTTADPLDGILFMKPDKWEPFLWFHLDGTIQSGGFLEPDVAKNLPINEEKAKELEVSIRESMIQSGEYLSIKDEKTVSRRAKQLERLVNGTRPLEDSRKDSRRSDYDEKLDPNKKARRL